MARNTKPEYIKKLLKLEAPKGYKFDVANYLYNPAYGYDYPAFIKIIDEDETTETIRRVYYFKYYGGTGEYKEEIYKRDKSKEGWQVITNRQEKTLEESNRFNLNKLLSLI